VVVDAAWKVSVAPILGGLLVWSDPMSHRNVFKQWKKRAYVPEAEIVPRATPKQRDFLMKHCGVSYRTASETPMRVASAIIQKKMEQWRKKAVDTLSAPANR